VEMTIAMRMPSEASELAARVELVRRSPLDAMAMELVNAPLAAALGLPAATTLLVRLGGNHDSVRAQHTTLARAGEIDDVPGKCWSVLREIEPPGAWVWRMSGLPSHLADAWTHAEAIARHAQVGWVHASVGRGIVRCICVPAMGTHEPGGAARVIPDSQALADAIARTTFGGTIIHERLPAARWPFLAKPMATDVISRRIRASFDPHGILNPGILGEVSS
jgi:FAD/FMN-containing dehydrogenase